MKVYAFRLQTKLDITLRQEDIAKNELRDMQAVYDHELIVLQRLKDYQTELFGDIRGKRGYLRIDDLILLKDYLKVLAEEIDNQNRVVCEAEENLEKARQHFMEIMRERKALEKLKERDYQEYLKEIIREEQALIDEVAIVRFWRSGMRESDDT